MAKNNFKLKILVVDDEAVVRSAIIRVLEGSGLTVKEAHDGDQCLEMMAGESFDIVLLDIKMPGMDGIEVLKQIRKGYPDTVVIMITGYPSIESAVESTKSGAMDYLVKPFRADDLENLVLKAQQITAKRWEQVPCEKREHREEPTIVGKSQAMQELIATIRRVAPTTSTVLVTGESGTGKELVARTIHNRSLRADNDYVPVECSSLVESLVESELFGHVKGAFTNAHETKNGLFELANHGTFFFDEISNLGLNTQAKLLRVIQEREFMKVGSRKRRRLDIRILAASNRDLRKEVEKGAFREDLYYRLNVVPIHLLPLRERPEDIGLLVEHFLKKYNHKCNCNVRGISEKALEMLISYSWPGNVRELEHLVERVLVLENCDVIRPEHLPPFITQRQGEFQVFSNNGLSLQEVEKRYIQFVLHRTNGRRQQAADILGINRKTLAAKIKKYVLRVKS
ncbi:MAG: sigma-54-dependent Fis family transcriptional regulator [Desulfobacterales bacterium]|nr:sigma-54-dependent Fis family transcriptional regulator [Desulfobacterales bacterium]